MSEVLFFDSTLRDGSHAVAHQLNEENIASYCRKVDNAGLYTIIIGHGNGLGASSLQVGRSLLTDGEMLAAARKELKTARLGAFLLPGFGTIKDNLGPAIDLGVELVCIGIHCTEADVTEQHIKYVRSRNREAYGVLMMCHMASEEQLLEEALKMQGYGAMGVILMDSAGASIPEEVYGKVKLLADNLKVKVGFHAHNNLGLAVANSYTAIKAGAKIIDGTMRGFGAGAGNCQLEVLAGLLQKSGLETDLKLYPMMDASETIVAKIMKKPQEITDVSLISGMAGVFSGFAGHVINAANRFSVDPRDIFMELGKRKIVAGQEDFVVDIAMYLARNKQVKEESYQLESLL